MPTKNTISQYDSKMIKAVEFLLDELKGLRTGRASTGLVEHLRVDYYGSPTPLKQLATLATPTPDSIVIKPFDAAAIKDIEKAIKSSDLSLAPMVEGKMIRLNIPPLSEERRKQLVNQAKQMGEQAKISVRNIRRDAIKDLEQQEKAHVITEDDLDKGKKIVDDLTKKYVDQIDHSVKSRSAEILEQ